MEEIPTEELEANERLDFALERIADSLESIRFWLILTYAVAVLTLAIVFLARFF
jgi:hypothetical protein